MNDDPRLSQLLDRWQVLRDSGKSASPAEVCSNCPELRPAFEQRLRQIAKMNQVARQGLEALPPKSDTKEGPADDTKDLPAGARPSPVAPVATPAIAPGVPIRS